MKYGISAFLLRPQQMIDVAVQGEKLGYDSLWVGEHVVTPIQSNSEFPSAGELDYEHARFSGQLPFFDPYAALAYVAALTKTLKLGISVSIVPIHDPFHLARSVATIDLFSKARFMLGVGSGWLKEEFDVMGIEFATRGKRLDEILDIMIRLFNEEITVYEGEHFKVPPVGFSPKPETRPHPPFMIGGHSKPALRRAALRGDGWFATGLLPEQMKPMIASINEMRTAAGRGALPFEISCHVATDLDNDLVERFRDAGVDRLVVSPWTRGRDSADGIIRFAERFF